ncbi:MAG: hypothetical protein DMG41_10060 [Acidobacteria bacterium]|nr:MAG: hypothetical protein AUH13_31530 [Acidobacteria bacterium 13_2_20CM_58_27]PYT71995.1 MAG: hypothetical protein DMG42_15430 [Acidobacteriota bacterium]PYT88925.1 MAG: hypothetical protein DMG41_10060 [Acidobacteriota bacterium]
MDIQDAQREVRSVYVGGFWGQLVASVIWMMSAALGTWVTPKASILTIVIGGFFIFPALSRENPFNSLAMQVAFVLPLSMLLLVPVGLYRLNWFFPALIVLVGAHYLPFASLYGTRMFLFLSAILVAVGVLFALCFSGTLALAHGSLDWPYSPSPGLGAASRPAKLPRLPFTDSPDGSLGRKRDYRDGDSQRRSQSAPTPHSSWLSGITAKVRTGGLFRFAGRAQGGSASRFRQ